MATFTFLALSLGSINAQKAATNWYFGNGAHIDFNTTVPTATAVTTISTSEGCSAVSDSTTGTTLFYTDGATVWDKNDNPMPTGTGLKGNSSSTHSALIVPCSCDKYFIFTTDAYENGFKNGLCYSIVDMTLNVLKGDVVAATKNTLLLANASEKIAGVSDGSGHFWLVGHTMIDNKFYAYRTRNNCTLDPPVVSAVGAMFKGGSHDFGLGQMKISPNGKFLAHAGLSYGWGSFVELFQFSTTTGAVSNLGSGTAHDGPNSDGFYGIEFSPDSNSLYATTIVTNCNVYRYGNISVNQLTSKTQISNFSSTPQNYVGALQLASDGKIYVAHYYQPSIFILSSPNAPNGGWTTTPFNLANPSVSRLGLPTVVAGDFSCSSSPTPTPTPTPTITPTPSPTPTLTPKPSGCAEVSGEPRCLPDGTYSYTFNVKNNSGNAASQILLTPAQGSTFTLSPQLTNLSPSLNSGQSTSITTTISNAKPGDKVCFFVSLMSEKTQCCIVEVCLTLPNCGDVTPTPTVTGSLPPPARQAPRGRRRP